MTANERMRNEDERVTYVYAHLDAALDSGAFEDHIVTFSSSSVVDSELVECIICYLLAALKTLLFG